MSKPTRESIFKEAAKRMRADFEDARNSVPHKGEAGGEGEAIVCQFLNSHLPSRFRATGGFIIDRMNKVSGHNDVIVYDAHNCPVYRSSTRGMIVPNDNVASVIEVKFDLTTTLLDSGLSKIHEAKNLAKTPQSPEHPKNEQIGTYGVLFAFECELAYGTVMDRWIAKLDEENPIYNSCSLIAVLDRGLFVTVGDVPGAGSAPADLQGLGKTPPGTKMGIAYFEFKESTLDQMLRLMLAHLTFFRHRIEHPGFLQFELIGPCPTRWVETVG